MDPAPRQPLSPPTAAMIQAEAAAQYGVLLPPDRADRLAGDVGRMLAAIDRAASQLAFEDEPAGFLLRLSETAR